MEKRVIVILIVVFAALCLWFALKPSKASCAGYCYSGTCYAAWMCGDGCACIRPDYGARGYCASVDYDETEDE